MGLSDAQLKALDEAEKTLPEAFDTTRVARNHMRALIDEVRRLRNENARLVPAIGGHVDARTEQVLELEKTLETLDQEREEVIDLLRAEQAENEKLRALLETARESYQNIESAVHTIRAAVRDVPSDGTCRFVFGLTDDILEALKQIEEGMK